jgi:hypothetical protein
MSEITCSSKFLCAIKAVGFSLACWITLAWFSTGNAGTAPPEPAAQVYEDTRDVSEAQLKALGFDMGHPDKKMILATWNGLFHWSEYEDSPAAFSVGSFVVKDVNGDGKTDMVALVNRSGTANPATLFTVCSTPSGYIAQQIETEYASAEDIRDLNGDGRLEIIANSEFGKVSGAYCEPWPDVYSWSPKGFKPNSRDFLQTYYIPIYLPKIAARIKRAEEMLEVSRIAKTDTDEVRLQKKRVFDLAADILAECQEAISRIAALAKESKSP